MSRRAQVKAWFSGRRPADERQAMQLIVALACLLVSLSVGYAYATHITVAGWQLWTWLLAVLVAVVVLLTGAGRPPLRLNRTWPWVLLLVMAALLLRGLFLDTVPGGLHVDEMGVANFSLGHVFPGTGETINPFRTGPASQPTLYHYLIRLSLAVAGENIAGLRLSSVVAGSLSVLATYALVAVYQNRRIALTSAVLLTAYHFHIHWSRLALNNIWDTLWVPLLLAAFAWGWQQRWSGGAVLAGLAAGLSQYFYAGSRLGLLLLAFVIWQSWRAEGRTGGGRRRLAGYVGLTLLVAAIVAAPLFMFALRDPLPFFERSRVVFAWKPETMAMVTGLPIKPLAFAWHQAWRSLGAFTAVPDVTGFYGPGLPLVIGLAGPLFAIGLLWAVYKRRWLPVLWAGLTAFLGGFLLSDPPGSSHYVVAIPAICWLVATPLEWLMENGRPRLAIALLVIIVLTDLVFYFGFYVPGAPRDLINAFPRIGL